MSYVIHLYLGLYFEILTAKCNYYTFRYTTCSIFIKILNMLPVFAKGWAHLLTTAIYYTYVYIMYIHFISYFDCVYIKVYVFIVLYLYYMGHCISLKKIDVGTWQY